MDGTKARAVPRFANFLHVNIANYLGDSLCPMALVLATHTADNGKDHENHRGIHSHLMNIDEKLYELQTLVRVGLPISELRTIGESRRPKVLYDRISSLLQEIGKQARLGEFERLKLASLAAEFQFNFGGPQEFAQKLEKLVNARKLLDWNLARRFFPEEPSKNQSLLRQRIWALMAIAFYGWYVAGRTEDAFKLLKQILRLIDIIDLPQRRPHGTWCRCHYFLAHCYRSRREFAEAEKHFLASQFHAHERLKRQLRRIDTNNDEEYLVATICCARILGAGLSWVAIQQGQLKRALHMLRTADTLLEPTGQEGLKLFVRSLVGLTQRRLFTPADARWGEGISSMVKCVESFRQLDDRGGMRRCLQELSRAYLDAACANEQNTKYLSKATEYIDALDGLTKDRSDFGPESFRASLFRTQLFLLRNDLESARLAIANSKQHSTLDKRSYYPDDDINLVLTEGMLAARAGDYTEAITCFQRALTRVDTESDPVLEAECVLRLGLVHAQNKDLRGARDFLQRWQNLDRFVDNFFLRTLQQKMYLEMASMEEHPTIIFQNLRAKAAEARFRQEFTRSVLARNGNSLGKALEQTGLTKSTFKRWTKGR